MNAVGYVRVSKAEQAMNGYSLDAQREVLQRYADEHDMNLIRIYADEGISASKALHKRKGILKLLDDAESQNIDVILFKDLTRWSRNPSQFYAVQDRLDKAHVAWIAVEQPNLETVTASGKLIVGIHISVAAHESAQIGERIKFVNESRIKNGNPLTGNFPLGYKIGIVDGEKRVVIDESKREYVNTIFDTFERTQCVNQTKVELSNQGLNMYNLSIRKMLRNPLYKGEYRDIKNYCEAFISEERWNTVQNLLDKRHYTAPVVQNEYIFSSLVKCAECGCSMVGRTKYKGTAYYGCNMHTIGKCGHYRMIREDVIEKYMIDMVNESLSNKQIVIKPKKKKSTAPVKAKLARLKDLYIDGDIDKTEYLRRKKEYESIDAETASEPQKPVFVQSWLEYYLKAPKQAKNVAWKAVIDKIVVDNDNNIEVKYVPFE